MTKDNTEPGKDLTFASPMMAAVSIFPVSKPNAGYIEKTNGNITITITPRKPEHWVYGKTPRLLFLYIQKLIITRDLCVNFEDRTIEFNDSFRHVCKESGISCTGARLREMDDVLCGLAGTTVTVTKKERAANDSIHEIIDACVIAEHVETWSDSYQHGTLSSIRFSEEFWRELVVSSIPVDMQAIASFGRSVRAIDIYLWLNYRTFQMRRPVRVTWGQLFDQFESTGMKMLKFQQQFREALSRVLAACPNLRVDVDRNGVVVHPSSRRARPSELDVQES